MKPKDCKFWRWMRHSERGAVLALALIVVLVMACMTGAFCQYYVNLANLSGYWVQGSGKVNVVSSYLGSEIETPIANVIDPTKNADAPANFTELKEELKKIFDKKSGDGKSLVGNVNGVEVVVDAKSLENFDLGEQEIGSVRELEILAITRDAHGGVAVGVREVLRFEMKGDDERTGSIFASYPVFDYAYFANNYGHLESKGIVVNGNVGSNDRFTIDSAVVNGYVNVHSATAGDKNAVRLKSTEKKARIWPYGVYMDKVTAEYKLDGNDYYTQVRPTNPIYVSSTSNMTWKGGYEPPGTFSYFGGEAGIDKEPQPPEKLTIEVPIAPSLSKTAYPDKPTKAAYPAEPKKGAYPAAPTKVYPAEPKKAAYPAEPKKAAYPSEPKKGAYPSEPKKGAYPKEPTKTYPDAPKYGGKDKSSGKKKNWEYYLYNGTKYYGDKQNDKNGAKKSAETAQKANEKKIDAEYKKTHDQWIIDCAKVDSDYEAAKIKYKEDCDKVDSDYEAALAKYKEDCAKVDSDYEAAKIKYKEDCAKVDSDYEAALAKYKEDCAKVDSDYEAAVKKWNEDKAKVDSDYAAAKVKWEEDKAKVDSDYAVKEAEWKTECAKIDESNANLEDEYKEKYAEYLVLSNSYAAAKSEYDKSYAAFELEHDAWETWKDSIDAGSEVDLDYDLYHKMSEGESKKIINVTTNFVTMPNVSDVDFYRNFCMTNKVIQTNLFGKVVTLRGGSLTCANRFKGYEVTENSNGKAVTNSVEKDISWKYNYANWVDWHILRLYIYPDDNPSFTTDKTPYTRTLTAVNVTGGYKSDITPFRSGDSAFNSVADVEKGSVILIGTMNYPITINGPVYFDGDVVIRGFVSGQGTIYAGRNVHVIGDITYLNPPNWPHANLGVSGNTPTEVAKNNRHRDMLMLVARGNVVVGDYTDPKWGQSFTNWVQSASTETDVETSLSFCNVIDDTDIGYPRDLSGFKRNYLAKESGGKILSTIDFKTEKYKEDKAYYQQSKLYYCLCKHYKSTPYATTGIRHYESRLGGAVIAGLMQGKDTTSSVSLPSSLWQRIVWGLSGHDATHVNTGDTNLDYSQTSGSISGVDDACDITAIDAVLFANHGIFGYVGGSNSEKFTLNGGIVCRDEGLLPEFKARNPNARVWINWDMRWSTSSQEANNSNGSPILEQVVAAPGGTSVEMSVKTRHQIPVGN